ncbi:MAG: hypothetical protein AAF667_09570 [Pseudomonadota bacterium]
MLQICLYRLFRLRRLIVFSVAIPILVVGLIAFFKGQAAMALVPLAVVPPLLHALRYPTAWMETVTVSVCMAVLLAFAGTIGADVGLLGLALRLVGLGILGAVLFIVLSLQILNLVSLGVARPFTARAVRRSSLTPEALRAAITLYPGREDDKVTCGPAAEDGLFPIRIRHSVPALEGDGIEDFDVDIFGIVLSETDETFELMSIPDGGEDTSLTQYRFTPVKGGTRVELAERGVPMTAGYQLGFWLQDYMADYLTDEIDRAEGRHVRANRFQIQDQLLTDVTRHFFGGLQGPDPTE